MDAVHVARVESDGVAGLSLHVLVGEEVVGHLRGPSHLAGSLQPQHQQIQHQPVVLHDEGGKLQASDNAIRVGVVHVLWGHTHIVYMMLHILRAYTVFCCSCCFLQ